MLNVIQTTNYVQNWQLYAFCAHNLEIKSGPHIDVPRESMICRLCSIGMVELEYHFILAYPMFSGLRSGFKKNTSWPPVATFTNIIPSTSSRFLMKLAKFQDSIRISSLLKTHAMLVFLSSVIVYFILYTLSYCCLVTSQKHCNLLIC